MKKLFLICGLLAMVTRPAGAGDQLKLAVSPVHSFAPALLRIQVRIAPSVVSVLWPVWVSNWSMSCCIALISSGTSLFA